MALEECDERSIPQDVDVDKRILTDVQLMRFEELESVLEFEGESFPDLVRGDAFLCIRAKKSVGECLDDVFAANGCDRGTDESGVDFNTVGVVDRGLLRKLATEAAAVRFAAVGRDFDFVDYKPVDLQGLHRYLCIDVFGDGSRVTHDVAAHMSDVFGLLPSRRVLDAASSREFAMRLAPFCAALFAEQTFAYNDAMAKRLFVMEMARSFGWDLKLRDVPVASLRSTLRVAGERPDMLSRVMRAQISDLVQERDVATSARFVEDESERGWLGKLRDWMGVE